MLLAEIGNIQLLKAWSFFSIKASRRIRNQKGLAIQCICTIPLPEWSCTKRPQLNIDETSAVRANFIAKERHPARICRRWVGFPLKASDSNR